jgi:hypothetical protein
MLVGEGQDWTEGEKQAWCKLARCSHAEVCQRTKARFNVASGAYILDVFNSNIEIYPSSCEMRGSDTLCRFLLENLAHYTRLSVLWYLLQAQDVLPSGNLVNPRELGGSGLIFTQGSHILPLDKLARKYEEDTAAFLRQGMSLGGTSCKYGDASIKLFPFPKIPVLVVLWRKDEEFPARVDLLLDDTCSKHLPPDIIWSTTMMSVLVML